MKRPSNLTEAELMKIIDNVANRLAARFKFGYHGIDDMRQQARLFAWEGLDGYNEDLPLENYLWTHVRNRLFNFKRDKYERPGNPCLGCKNDKCMSNECETYNKWMKNSSRKKNLMNPIDIESIVDEHEENMRNYENKEGALEYAEMMDTIREELSVGSYKMFIKLLSGAKMSKVQKTKIQEELAEIFERYGYST